MQLSKTNYFFTITIMLTAAFVSAQKDAEYLYEGNQMYHSGKLPESSTKYSRALELNPNNKKANFNLGNALYKNAVLIKEGKLLLPAGNTAKPDSIANMIFDQAAQNFAVVANSVSDKDTLHQAWHNIGNCYLQKKEYQQAVDAYKKSLKFNPKDEETRYNLAYALKNLPKEKKKGGGGQSDQPQDKKQQNKSDKNPQPQPSQMNKDQAEQLLKALMNSEKKLQDKRKPKGEQSSNSVEKDW